MKRTWVEMSCDKCGGSACHYPPGNVDKAARKDGWIITKDKKHFCTEECYEQRKTNDH